MNEHYLEWMFLREHLDYWINEQFPEGETDVLMYRGKQYDVQKMKERYIVLSEMLLKDYELP